MIPAFIFISFEGKSGLIHYSISCKNKDQLEEPKMRNSTDQGVYACNITSIKKINISAFLFTILEKVKRFTTE
jgi:hypothetical protein